jgi:hypothetical protein
LRSSGRKLRFTLLGMMQYGNSGRSPGDSEAGDGPKLTTRLSGESTENMISGAADSQRGSRDAFRSGRRPKTGPECSLQVRIKSYKISRPEPKMAASGPRDTPGTVLENESGHKRYHGFIEKMLKK